MSVDAIKPIGDSSQVAAVQAVEEYLVEKKKIADEQSVKAEAVHVAKVTLEAENLKKMEDEKQKEATFLKADQAEKYHVTKETNKEIMEAKYAKMDAVTHADASHFHAAEVNSKAAQDKASATIDQNTVVLEEFLAAKTSTAEVNRRADNAAATDVANSNILDSSSETEQAVEAYHDNMAKQNTLQQSAHTTEAAGLGEAGTLTTSKNTPTPRINVMD